MDPSAGSKIGSVQQLARDVDYPQRIVVDRGLRAFWAPESRNNQGSLTVQAGDRQGAVSCNAHLRVVKNVLVVIIVCKRDPIKLVR